MEPRERIARSAGLAGAATLASRLLGLARDQVLAGFFGASHEMDAFVVAFRIPNLVRDLFAEGAMSAALVPTFTSHRTHHGTADAWRLANHVLNALLVITGAVVVIGVVFAGPLLTTFAGDFARVPGKLELTILLARLMLPFLTLAAVAATLMGMLNSLHYYFLPALAPATFNAATIVCAFMLIPIMPAFGLPPIVAIAVATLVGGLGQIALQWAALSREGFRYRAMLDLRNPDLRRLLLLMGPGTIGLAATQVNLFVGTLMATTQEPGAVSWLQYAFRLIYLPIGLFGVSIATAVLPTVARHAAVHDPGAISRTVARGIGLMIIVNVPAAVGLFVLADDIVRVLFEHGRFLPTDTTATAAALRCYVVGLIGYSATRIASPIFYTLGQGRVPVTLSSASIAVNVLLSLMLVRAIGFRGLALATSIAAIVNGGLSLLLLRRLLGGLHGPRLAVTFAKISAASLVMALAVLGIVHGMSIFAPGTSLAMQGTRLLAAIAGGVTVLAFGGRLLQIREFDELVSEARRWVQKLLRGRRSDRTRRDTI